MEVFKILNGYNAHALHFVYDRPSHLRAIIALDSIVEGRAIGGIRLKDYQNEGEAIEDACQLGRAMSFKAAIHELPCGGGKTVIYKHPNMKRSQAFKALGRAIEQLDGLYHSGLDVGTTMKDLANVASETHHVSHALEFGKHTARGVHAAISAAVKLRLGLDSLKEVRVAIQGLGSVGMELATMLYRSGARLVVSDTAKAKCNQAKKRFKADVVAPDKILFEPCDVLAPCALGSQLSVENTKKLACSVVAGSANNLLRSPAAAQALDEAEITYVPDFISSGGALIIGANEIAYGKSRAKAKLVDGIYDTTVNVLRTAKRRKITPLHAAETLAAKVLKR